MEPWQSWALIGAVGAGGYLYYSRSQKPARGRTQKQTIATAAQEQARRPSSVSRDPSKGRKQKGKGRALDGGSQTPTDIADGPSASAAAGGNEKTSKKKAGKKQPSNHGKSTAVEVEPPQADDDDVKEDEMDNKEFARQMAGLKVGDPLKKDAAAGETRKTRKQGKQNEARQTNGKAVDHRMSTTSSTTGADADDDLSPAASPDLGASQMASNAGGVADMLEAPAKGPSILRVTPSTQNPPERQQKVKKEAPEPESKKQRQNRKKIEEKKAAREEAEKERRVLLEKQRRTAREAEGRPAKNGLGPAPPTSNAWSPSAAPKASSAQAPSNTNGAGTNGSLLDTFDENTKPASSAAGVNGHTQNQKSWQKDMPSEEEQMRMLSKMEDDGWNTVQKGGKTKKKNTTKVDDASTSEDNLVIDGYTNGQTAADKKTPAPVNTAGKGSSKPLHSPSNGVAPPKSKMKKDQVDPTVWNHSNIHKHPEYDPAYPYQLTGHPQDSDWAVV